MATFDILPSSGWPQLGKPFSAGLYNYCNRQLSLKLQTYVLINLVRIYLFKNKWNS